MSNCPSASDSEETSILKEAKELGKVMDLNIVRLKFTAFLQDSNGGFTRALKPVVSNPIYDSSESTHLNLTGPMNTWGLPVVFTPAADWLTDGSAGVFWRKLLVWHECSCRSVVSCLSLFRLSEALVVCGGHLCCVWRPSLLSGVKQQLSDQFKIRSNVFFFTKYLIPTDFELFGLCVMYFSWVLTANSKLG